MGDPLKCLSTHARRLRDRPKVRARKPGVGHNFRFAAVPWKRTVGAHPDPRDSAAAAANIYYFAGCVCVHFAHNRSYTYIYMYVRISDALECILKKKTRTRRLYIYISVKIFKKIIVETTFRLVQSVQKK